MENEFFTLVFDFLVWFLKICFTFSIKLCKIEMFRNDFKTYVAAAGKTGEGK